MAIEETAERAVFFDIGEFGVAAVHKLQGPLTTQTVNGIFEDPTEAIVTRADLPVALPGPVFTCAVEGLQVDWAVGDELQVAGVDYAIVDFNKDGTGLITILLETV